MYFLLFFIEYYIKVEEESGGKILDLGGFWMILIYDFLIRKYD